MTLSQDDLMAQIEMVLLNETEPEERIVSREATDNDRFSPVVNSRLETVQTGKLHRWIDSKTIQYYGNSYLCRDCGRESWGWNLWREDFLHTCPGDPK